MYVLVCETKNYLSRLRYASKAAWVALLVLDDTMLMWTRWGVWRVHLRRIRIKFLRSPVFDDSVSTNEDTERQGMLRSSKRENQMRSIHLVRKPPNIAVTGCTSPSHRISHMWDLMSLGPLMRSLTMTSSDNFWTFSTCPFCLSVHGLELITQDSHVELAYDIFTCSQMVGINDLSILDSGPKSQLGRVLKVSIDERPSSLLFVNNHAGIDSDYSTYFPRSSLQHVITLSAKILRLHEIQSSSNSSWWAVNTKGQHVHHVLYAHLFSMFADIVCGLADHFTDFENTIQLLMPWAAAGSASFRFNDIWSSQVTFELFKSHLMYVWIYWYNKLFGMHELTRRF